jgi:hypothetical protein
MKKEVQKEFRNINVAMDTWRILAQLKLDNNFDSFEDVVQLLLKKYNPKPALADK